ncbi:MAG: phage holin family protein [Trueperaceae bacterium]
MIGFQYWRDYPKCEHWMASVIIAIVACVYAIIATRYTLPLLLAVLPVDSWATQSVVVIVTMSTGHFAATAGIAMAGGITSFLRDVKSNPANRKLINALGHMMSAQFAGMLVYLLAIEYSWSQPLALFACGIAGWGGNHAIQKLSDMAFRKIGIDTEKHP